MPLISVKVIQNFFTEEQLPMAERAELFVHGGRRRPQAGGHGP